MKRRCKSFVTISIRIFLVSLVAISVSAQSSRSVPEKPAKVKRLGKKATLPQLYEMFFAFAAHVEAKADAEAKLGRDLSFYRWHLQRASGLDEVEYARVLDAAQRFTAVNADVQEQLSELMKVARSQSGTSSSRLTLPAGYKTRIDGLQAQKAESLKNEIANVRRVLGEERANMFETYLRTKYIMHRVGPALPETNGPAVH